MPFQLEPALAPWRARLWRIIFETDTTSGRTFDVALLIAIVASVIAVMLESVTPVANRYGPELRLAEYVFTGLFTIEYVLRLLCVTRPFYARSLFGIIDLIAILPTYLSFLLPGAQSLLVIRALRLLRVFRVLKLGRFLGEANVLTTALRASRRKVLVFLGTVLVLVLIFGTAMYLIEGEESGFTSIPRAMYWAVVTMTTVGYGDITPLTVPGQVLAAFIMIMGYSIIAVPTGIVSAEMVEAKRTARRCPSCGGIGHDTDAQYCKHCGESLLDR
jgi:voltage-gated potassium channel